MSAFANHAGNSGGPFAVGAAVLASLRAGATAGWMVALLGFRIGHVSSSLSWFHDKYGEAQNGSNEGVGAHLLRRVRIPTGLARARLDSAPVQIVICVRPSGPCRCLPATSGIRSSEILHQDQITG